MAVQESSAAKFERRRRRIKQNLITTHRVGAFVESAIVSIQRSAGVIERNQLRLTLYALELEIAAVTVEIDAIDSGLTAKIHTLDRQRQCLMEEAEQLRDLLLN